MATSTQNTLTSPVPIPTSRSRSGERLAPPPSPSHTYHNVTTSESEDESPNTNLTSSPSRDPSGTSQSHPAGKEGPLKAIVSGYLMKCGSKRRNWRKRWFVLNEKKLIYSGSHMVRRLTTTVTFFCGFDAMMLQIGYQATP